MAPISRKFVESIERFIQENEIPVVEFRRGQRKDEVAKERLAKFDREEGIVFVGKAQEKATVFRTEKRRNASAAASVFTGRSQSRISLRTVDVASGVFFNPGVRPARTWPSVL
jgi:hypothetical protein